MLIWFKMYYDNSLYFIDDLINFICVKCKYNKY